MINLLLKNSKKWKETDNDIILYANILLIQIYFSFNLNYNDFFNSGKQARLVSTIATFLGISPDRIKIVNVRSGSTIINM